MIRRRSRRLRNPRLAAGTGRLVVTIHADTTAFVEAMRSVKTAIGFDGSSTQHTNCRCSTVPPPAVLRRELLHKIRLIQDRMFIEAVGAKERAIAVEWFETHANELWESLGMERPNNIVRGES